MAKSKRFLTRTLPAAEYRGAYTEGVDRTKLRNPATCTREYTPEEAELLKAVETYRRRNRRKFVTPCEILAIVKSLGYRQIETPGELPKLHCGK